MSRCECSLMHVRTALTRVIPKLRETMRWSYCPLLWPCYLVLVCSGVAIENVYMDDHCGDTVSVISGAILHLTSSDRYDPKLSCSVQILGNQGWVFMVKFRMLDIEGSRHCATDSLKIYDGFKDEGNASLLTGVYGLCGEDAPSQTYLSTSNRLTFSFISDECLQEDGFTAVVTNYHNGACTNITGEFRCDNGRCISRAIICDSYNHCGDWSDEEVDCMFGLGKGAIIGIVLGGTVLFIILAGCVIFATCNNRSSGRRGHRTALGPVGFWGSPGTGSDDRFTNQAYGIERNRY